MAYRWVVRRGLGLKSGLPPSPEMMKDATPLGKEAWNKAGPRALASLTLPGRMVRCCSMEVGETLLDLRRASSLEGVRTTVFCMSTVFLEREEMIGW